MSMMTQTGKFKQSNFVFLKQFIDLYSPLLVHRTMYSWQRFPEFIFRNSIFYVRIDWIAYRFDCGEFKEVGKVEPGS